MGAKSPVVPFPPSSTCLSAETSNVSASSVTDFSDRESQRVLAAAARALAHELGREAARDYFAELIGRSRAPR